MKPIIAAAAFTLALGAFAAAKTTVTWTTGPNTYDENKKPEYIQRFTVRTDTAFARLGFNQFARGMKTVNPADTLIEIVPGYYCIASPRFGTPGETVVVELATRGHLVNGCYAPDGVHTIFADGSTAAAQYTRLPITNPEQWRSGSKDKMVYGPDIYTVNDALRTTWRPGVYDVLPSYKKVKLTGGTSRVGKNPVFVDIDPINPDYYTIDVRNDSVIVSCRPDKQWAAMYPFSAKVLMPNNGKPLPNVHIENWPDHEWRGQHIDIARNYQSPAVMKVVVELMAANHLNRLHFHFSDDEAWRLEIAGLPELTELGSRRGYSTNGETDHLYQIFAGDGNPDNPNGTANGYWTRKDFVDFIRHAHYLGVDVLPEVESPGHARAAIKAMEARARVTGDSTYRLIHDNDTSKYTSAQAFHDNVMNPALPGPYKFMGKVFDEIISMYREAAVPLLGIHIGGDEVPRGSWNGSDKAQEFMRQNGMKTEKELHAYFVRRMAQRLAESKVPMFGWEEIAVGHGDDFNAEVQPRTGGVHCWHATPEAAIKSVKAGYPTILSNVNRFYLDMSYSTHPEERGLTWGGTVDEFDALHGYLEDMCPVDTDSVKGRVIGVQGQVWSETIRSPKDLYTMLLPKMLGLAERAWNATPTYTDARFNAIIGNKELPMYMSPGSPLQVHMRQPGIKIERGRVHMNAPYEGGTIRYTTDGTEPNAKSAVYTAPFAAPKAKPGQKNPDIRARYFRNGVQSVTTYLEQ